MFMTIGHVYPCLMEGEPGDNFVMLNKCGVVKMSTVISGRERPILAEICLANTA